MSVETPLNGVMQNDAVNAQHIAIDENVIGSRATRPVTIRNIPQRLPFFGHALALKRFYPHFLIQCRELAGEFFKLNFFNKELYVVCDLPGHEFVLLQKDDKMNFPETMQFILPAFYGSQFKYNPKIDFPFGHTQAVRPALREHIFKEYRVAIANETHKFMNELPDEGHFNAFDIAQHLLIRTAARSFLGADLPDGLIKDFCRYFSKLAEQLNLVDLVLAKSRLTFLSAREKTRIKIKQNLQEIVKHLEKNGNQNHFIVRMKSYKTQDGSSLTEDEFTGLIIQFIFAAHGPASAALTWLMKNTLSHQHVLERLTAEIKAHTDKDGVLDYELLPYMEATIKETLRYDPPIVAIVRKVKEDMSYKGQTIPKDSYAAIFPELSHRNESIFTSANAFDPARFDETSPKFDKQRPLGLITFSAGEHRCIGQSFALLQLKIIWATMLKTNQFAVKTYSPQKTFKGMLVIPKKLVLSYQK